MAESQQFVLAAGSNIDPRRNLPAALRRLEDHLEVRAVSKVYETEPVGAPGSPPFWNAAVLVESDLPPMRLKNEVLRPIEAALGRRRTDDRNAPRPIDLDLVLSNRGRAEEPATGLLLPDPDLATCAHIARPAGEVAPDWVHPDEGQTIAELAARFASEGRAVELPEWRLRNRRRPGEFD
jgi:2-amino-4-hydroxy-6-hydroxymethyldihydropteridine diphosphokinase